MPLLRPARLTGTVFTPVVELSFPFGAKHPFTGEMLRDWVKTLPDRRWNPDRKTWMISGVGPDPDKILVRAGFEVDMEGFLEANPTCKAENLADLSQPVLKLSTSNPDVVLARHRMCGSKVMRQRLGNAVGKFDPERGWWVFSAADVTDHNGRPFPNVVYGKGIMEESKRVRAERRHRRTAMTDLQVAASEAALSTGIGDDDALQAAEALELANGAIPDWFGITLFPYQKLGALAVCGGHNMLCDEPGLGKTYGALAAASMSKHDRVLVITPPVTLTSWRRQSDLCRIVDDEAIGIIHPGRKVPSFDDKKMLIVSDSLVAARPELCNDLVAWNPDVILIDEAHRLGGIDTKRSLAVRNQVVARVREAGDPLVVPVTGTPLLTKPTGLIPLLELSGHLEPLFGSAESFLSEFCYQNQFGKWLPRKGKLPELRKILDDHVWVRRRQSDVLKDLPPKRWSSLYFDVDLRGYNAAHADVAVKIDEWLDSYEQTYERLPDMDEVEAWTRGKIGLISPLRKAAGLSKVPAAIEYARDWVAEQKDAQNEFRWPSNRFDRPLLMWCWHREVMDEIVEVLQDEFGQAAIRKIDGGTTMTERDRNVDDWQAGKVAVMVAQIQAAGVGITLTAGCDALFVESDWVSETMSQAERRLDRIGQKRPVSFVTMIAVGTLDAHMATVRSDRANLNSVVTSEDVSAREDEIDAEDIRPFEVLNEIARGCLERRIHRAGRRR